MLLLTFIHMDTEVSVMSRSKKIRDPKTRLVQWAAEIVAMMVARRVIRRIIRKF
jgi:hypothetical protein